METAVLKNRIYVFDDISFYDDLKRRFHLPDLYEHEKKFVSHFIKLSGPDRKISIPKWLQKSKSVPTGWYISDSNIVVWIGGKWVSGEWRNGVWLSGTWKNGTWNGGVWVSGTWERGTAIGDDFIFYRGVLKNGNIKSKHSYITSAIIVNSTIDTKSTVMGYILGGRFRNLIFLSGTISDAYVYGGYIMPMKNVESAYLEMVKKREKPDISMHSRVFKILFRESKQANTESVDNISLNDITVTPETLKEKKSILMLNSTCENVKIDKISGFDSNLKNCTILGGTLYNCSVYNSIWKTGTWLSGVATDIYWNDGTWTNGSLENSTWRFGIFENGIAKNIKWEGGIFKNGTFNGTWYGGKWKSGVWKGGKWHGGEVWNADRKEFERSSIPPKTE